MPNLCPFSASFHSFPPFFVFVFSFFPSLLSHHVHTSLRSLPLHFKCEGMQIRRECDFYFFSCSKDNFCFLQCVVFSFSGHYFVCLVNIKILSWMDFFIFITGFFMPYTVNCEKTEPLIKWSSPMPSPRPPPPPPSTPLPPLLPRMESSRYCYASLLLLN